MKNFDSLIIIYGSITIIFWVISALVLCENKIKEINNFYDWCFYGALWPLIMLKYLFIFITDKFLR